MSHGRGIEVLAPRSQFYQGPFGRICRGLPVWRPAGVDDVNLQRHFLDFANAEMLERPGVNPNDLANEDAVKELEAEFNSKIPAGYTYFGQFIDHDITFDPASSLERANDPNGLLNHRTPRLDLDNLYAGGPDVTPYIYDQNDKDKFLIGQVPGTALPDLPRNVQERALIGDMRNDENAIVAQLHLAFLLAHNTLVDRARDKGLTDPFEAARCTLRWLYQYIVWNDFIVRIAIDQVHGCALVKRETCDGRLRWELGLKDVYKWRNQPFMPVEFSVAAYRFGHSMVRNSYQTNDPLNGFNEFVPIFNNIAGAQGPNLRGFRQLTGTNYIQWDWFLEMTTSGGPFPQRARKIDTKLSNALAFLHEGPPNDPLNVLAMRNLLRGVRLGLPSGSDVARKLGLTPIDIDPNQDSLWFYILKESAQLRGANGGQMLGRLGSTIVCAVFAGLLKGDPNSFYTANPCWTPDDSDLLCDEDNVDSDDWSLSSIIRLSGLPVSGDDF